MRAPLTGCLLVMLGLQGMAIPIGAWAQGTAPSAAVDLSGVWWNEHRVEALTPQDSSGIPFTAMGTELYEKSRAALMAKRAAPLSRNSVDRCLPLGPLRILEQNYPVQIIQKGPLLLFLYEHNHVYDIVYLNQPSDPDRDPAFMGNSVGRWTTAGLEVTTAAFKPGTLLDDSGLPHSSQLSLVRVLHRSADGRRLDVNTTITDPVVFAKSWQVHQVLARHSEASIQEYACGQGPTLEDRYSRQANSASSGPSSQQQ